MKIKHLLMASAIVLVSSCSGKAQTPNYTVSADLNTPQYDGTAAYLVDFDNETPLDSCTVTGGKASFTGNIGDARFVRLIVDGNRVTSFVLEPADITISEKGLTGGPLNSTLSDINDRLGNIEASFAALPADATDEQRQALYDSYQQTLDSAMRANIGNPVGYYIFIQTAMELEPEEVRKLIEANPQMKSYQRVQKLLAAQQNRIDTGVGHKYKDFAVEYNGKTERLSDYVKPGRYTLVDFWASWCGPCIRQTAVIKKLYNEYKDKGLDVVGVAVWDEPDNTLAAIRQHDLEWPCIINAGTIPTDLYGIQGIPCIILIGPDGTILSRDKQDDELINEVKAAMDKSEVRVTSDEG